MPSQKYSKKEDEQILAFAVKDLRDYRRKTQYDRNQGTTNNSKIYIPSHILAEITVEFLKNHAVNPNKNKTVEDIIDRVKHNAGIFIQATTTLLADETGISESIIKNTTLRLLRKIKDANERILDKSESDIDEDNYEKHYNRNVKNYQVFFGDAIKKIDRNLEQEQEAKERRRQSLGSSPSMPVVGAQSPLVESNLGVKSNSDPIKKSEPLTSEQFQLLKKEIETDLLEFKDEIEETLTTIEKSALEQIQAGDVILTVGYCDTMAGILKRAGEKFKHGEKIHVVVAQGPNNAGEKMARVLKKGNCCDVSFITDSSIYVALLEGFSDWIGLDFLALKSPQNSGISSLFLITRSQQSNLRSKTYLSRWQYYRVFRDSYSSCGLRQTAQYPSDYCCWNS